MPSKLVSPGTPSCCRVRMLLGIGCMLNVFTGNQARGQTGNAFGTKLGQHAMALALPVHARPAGTGQTAGSAPREKKAGIPTPVDTALLLAFAKAVTSRAKIF